LIIPKVRFDGEVNVDILRRMSFYLDVVELCDFIVQEIPYQVRNDGKGISFFDSKYNSKLLVAENGFKNTFSATNNQISKFTSIHSHHISTKNSKSTD
jgi:hypothetical protein